MRYLLVLGALAAACASTDLKSTAEMEACALQADRKAIAAYLVYCTDEGHTEADCPEFQRIDAQHVADLKECYGL